MGGWVGGWVVLVLVLLLLLGGGEEGAKEGSGAGALAVDIELEEEGVRRGGGGDAGDDLGGGVAGARADALDDALGVGGARDGQLAVRVDQLGHGGRRDEERERAPAAEDGGLGADGGDVAHYPRSEPDAGEEGDVRVAGDEVGGGGGVEGPGFGAAGLAGGELEVVGAEDAA